MIQIKTICTEDASCQHFADTQWLRHSTKKVLELDNYKFYAFQIYPLKLFFKNFCFTIICYV